LHGSPIGWRSRSDICALPSGVSVPHMFIVTFVIMLPITIKTGDPMKGWSAGLVWVFFQSFILMIGGFIAPYIRSQARWRRTKVAAVKSAAIASLPQQGVLYHGLEVMGGGSILAGLVLGAIGVFVIERDFVKASAFAFSGAILTYFGFMHGEAVGIGDGLGVTPAVALAYAVVAVGKFGTSATSVRHPEMPLAAPAE
jgi:uncharacterized membrane protein